MEKKNPYKSIFCIPTDFGIENGPVKKWNIFNLHLYQGFCIEEILWYLNNA